MDLLKTLYIFLFVLVGNIFLNAENDIVISGILEPRFMRMNRRGVFSGFIPDLVAEIAEIANFNFSFRLVNEGRGGGKGNNRRQLRQDALDELTGYRHGITALFKRPPKALANPIKNFEDLLYQTEYVFGTIIRSSIDRFFGRTMESPYWELGGFMDMYDEYMVENVPQGLRNVREGLEYLRTTIVNPILKHRLMDLKYMLFVDSTIADHLMHKFPCDLVSFGKIRSKGYGFAFRKGDALLRYKIDDALRILIRNGTVARLKEKWWKDDERCDFESRYYYY